MIRNPILAARARSARVIFADGFTDPELGPSWRLQLTWADLRASAIVTDDELRDLERDVTIRRGRLEP